MPTVAHRTGDNQLVKSTGVAQAVTIAPARKGAAAEIFWGGKKGNRESGKMAVEQRRTPVDSPAFSSHSIPGGVRWSVWR